MATRINYIDVYSFYSELEAGVMESLMDDYRIGCSIRTLSPLGPGSDPSGFPEKRIAVEKEKVESARVIIKDAIRKGMLSGEGRFVS